MATKFSFISELAEKTSKKIASNPREWKAFLKAAAQIYKYPFTDQLLIYAQRPEATACASITIWNNRMHRWVNRGSKGIALIDTARGKPRLKYVFDVKDTHEGKNSLYPRMWKLSYTNRDAVMDKLGSKILYHATSNKQKIRDIVESGSQTQGVEVSKSEMQGFDKYAKKYHFEYSMTREKNDKTQYFFTFRAKDMDRMQNAANDWFKDGKDHESIKQKLEEAAEKAYSVNKAAAKEKAKGHDKSKGRNRSKAR